MTTTTAVLSDFTDVPVGDATGHRFRWAVADMFTITKRNLIAYTRIPEALFFSTLQPIMFVLLFRYVFGSGAIPIGGGVSYINYLMAGILVQSVGFGGIGTAVGLSDDLHTGLIERFRALPMARSAVLAGRTLADVVRNVFVILLITGVGTLVGFSFPTGAVHFIYAGLLVMLFSYSLLWGFAVIGLIAPNSETAQVMAFPILFPLIFASPAFVRLQSLPGWMQAFASHQPVGAVVEATRALVIGGTVGGRPEQYVPQALAWCFGLLVVLVPVAVWRYRQSTS
jgi:ABC transporter DrrB family efflux protein